MAQELKVVELKVLEPPLLQDIAGKGSINEVENALKHFAVDQKNQFQQTSLHVMCELERPEILEILINSGANIDAQDAEGVTPLMMASKQGSLCCLQKLLTAGANVHAMDNVGWTSVMWAAYKGHSDIINVLLANGANVHVLVSYNMTPLLWAAGRGHVRIVKMLLEKGAKVNATDKFGSTSLIWACRRGFQDIVRILLEYGVDADAVGANGANALISAAQNGHEACIKLILNHGNVNVNHTDKNTNSALSYAAKLGKYETILLLLNVGAYLNVTDKHGDTALIKAVKNGHLDAVRALLSRFADVDIKGKNNATALHHACDFGHTAIVHEILSCNADMEAVNDDGDTALLRVVKQKNATITRMLLDKGARVTATDKKKDTSLHIAIRARSLRLVKLLLRNPQDGRLLYEPNKAGETPYNIDAAHNKSMLTNVFGAKNMSPESTMQGITGQGIPQSYDLYSSALADILCEPTLTPPLTVGLYAKWGSGKSFLLKRLEEQMKVFTGASCNKVFKKPGVGSFVLVLVLSIFLGFLSSTLTPSSRIVSGVAVGCSVFFLYVSCVAVLTLGAFVGEWKWAQSLLAILNEQFSYLELLGKLWFMVPPYTKHSKEGKAVPVRFLFTNYSRLTSVGGETSLAEMIGLLSSLTEKKLGFWAVRIFRAFQNDTPDNADTLKYKRICCIPTVVLAIYFLLSTGVIILLTTSAYGPEPTLLDNSMSNRNSTKVHFSALTATLVVLSTFNIAILFIATPTLLAIFGALIWSQRKRVMSAAHDSMSQERRMQRLKQEVDLLCQTVIAIDAFTNTQTRMCVTINGLDSCEQDKVLQVLDIVHVLFSQRPYITILAIDPVIISKAIHGNLNSVFHDANISGYDYLKNIVHLPFYLKDRTRNIQQKHINLDREDIQTDLDSDTEVKNVATDGGRSTGSGMRASSFTNRRANGVRRSNKALDLGRLMFSEDWFNIVSPQLMKRILNIVSLTGRLLRADGIDFSWAKLASWINLTEQWPYRSSFIIHTLEKADVKYPQTALLRSVFDKNHKMINPADPMLTIDSSDDRSFCAFLSARNLSVQDVKDFLPSTVNLDPKLLEIIDQDPYKIVQHSSVPHSASYPKYLSVNTKNTKYDTESPISVPGSANEQTEPTASLDELTTEDVANKLYEIKGLLPDSVDRYVSFMKENNVNGSVLFACELDDLKKELFAPFGDWCLIKQWILKMRNSRYQDVTIT